MFNMIHLPNHCWDHQVINVAQEVKQNDFILPVKFVNILALKILPLNDAQYRKIMFNTNNNCESSNNSIIWQLIFFAQQHYQHDSV